jgi:uncharacterized protein YbjT (DUF2867 family)
MVVCLNQQGISFIAAYIYTGQIIVRPATVFGAEDRFLNWIAEASNRLPIFPLINGGSALVQPVYAYDVGRALMAIVKVSV